MTDSRQHGAGGASFARSAGAAAGKGIALVVLAVAIGVLLLSRGFDDYSPTTVSAGENSTTTEAASPDTSDEPTSSETTDQEATTSSTTTTQPPPVARDPAEVKVLVRNGAGVQGAARANTEELLAKAYNALAPTDTKDLQKYPATSVYYLEGFQLEAQAVAEVLGIEAAAVAPLPDPAPEDPEAADVLVVLGQDGQGIRPG